MARAAIKRLMGEYQALLKEEDRVGDVYARPLDDNIFEWHFTILGPRRLTESHTSCKTKPAPPPIAASSPVTAAAPSAEDHSSELAGSASTERAPHQAPSDASSRAGNSHSAGDTQAAHDSDGDDGAHASPYRDGIYHGRLIFPRTYPLEPPDIVFLTPSGRFVTREKICSSISSFHKESWRPSYDIRFTLLSLRMFMAQEDEQGVGAIPRHAFSDAAKQRLARQSWGFVCSECKAHDEASGACAAGWSMRVLYDKEMKPYRETSTSIKASTPSPPMPSASASASPLVAAAEPVGSPQGETVRHDSGARVRPSDDHPQREQQQQQQQQQPSEVTTAVQGESGLSPAGHLTPLEPSPSAQTAKNRLEAAPSLAPPPLPAPAPQDVVVVRIHHLTYTLSVVFLWRVIAACACVVALVLARRGVAGALAV